MGYGDIANTAIRASGGLVGTKIAANSVSKIVRGSTRVPKKSMKKGHGLNLPSALGKMPKGKSKNVLNLYGKKRKGY